MADQIYNLASTGEQTLVNMTVGLETGHWNLSLFVRNLTDDRTPSSVTRYVDQMNLNVASAPNPNPAQVNVAGTTATERSFWWGMPPKRQFGLNASYRF